MNKDSMGACQNDKELLKARQGYSLNGKIHLTEQRIHEWVEHWGVDKVYGAFSGGLDSTVMMDIVWRLYPEIPGVFVNTGLEYPEVVKFVKTFDRITWLKPKMPFREVLEKYGYPVASKEVSQKVSEWRHTKSDKLRNKRWNGDDNKYKSGKIPEKWKPLCFAPFEVSHKCCDIMKKNPFKTYERETGRRGFVGTMAADSHFRRQSYLRHGCNAFESKRARSMPLAFWKSEDVREYVNRYELRHSEIYDMVYESTGCAFCAFGVHMEKSPNKFQRMAKTHPKLHEFCMEDLGVGEVLAYCKIPMFPDA